MLYLLDCASEQEPVRRDASRRGTAQLFQGRLRVSAQIGKKKELRLGRRDDLNREPVAKIEKKQANKQAIVRKYKN